MENHRRILIIDAAVRSTLGVSLMLLYFVGHIGIVGFHHLAHAWDQHAHHTHAEEADPCHRAIYHAEKDACEHPTHLGEEKGVCTYCQFVFGQQGEAEQITESDRQWPSTLVSPAHCTIYRGSILGSQPSRGPPTT